MKGLQEAGNANAFHLREFVTERAVQHLAYFSILSLPEVDAASPPMSAQCPEQQLQLRSVKTVYPISL